MAVGDAVSAPVNTPPPSPDVPAQTPPVETPAPTDTTSPPPSGGPSLQGSGYALAGAANSAGQMWTSMNANIQKVDAAYAPQQNPPNGSSGSEGGGSDLFVQQLMRASRGGSTRV
jgi:hypothetical protein